MNLHFVKGLVMWYMHRPGRIKKYIERNKRNEERIRKKDSITVVFFASNVSMWHYQGLYEEMLKYPRFKPYIVLSPLNAYAPEQKIWCVEELRNYFRNKSVNYIDYDTKMMKGFDVKRCIKPDLLFYPQPYYTVMCREHRYYRFRDSLLCYYPYFFHLDLKDFEYNEDFHNRAWRLFYESELQKRDAAIVAAIGDYNVRVVGYPNADEFLKAPIDVWKPQNRRKKRIIWAPHFTIWDDGWIQTTNFLWMADYMLNLAKLQKDVLQIAFKPHPRLLSELYKHPQWGKSKADAYYQQWKEMDNTQLEEGAFINLFMTSDAMIHDSSSFSVEYLYCGNPVMYISKDITPLVKNSSDFAKKVYDAHYIGKDKVDIETFIQDIVLGGKDYLKEKRNIIRDYYLMPPNGKSCAANTMDDLLISLETV